MPECKRCKQDVAFVDSVNGMCPQCVRDEFEAKQKQIKPEDLVSVQQITQQTSEGPKTKVKVELEPETIEAVKNFNSMREKACQELTKLGIETSMENIKTHEDLKRSIETIKKLKESHSKTVIHNVVASEDLQKVSKEGEFETMQELIAEQYRIQREGTEEEQAEAKKTLDFLWQKAVKGGTQLERSLEFEDKSKEAILDQIEEHGVIDSQKRKARKHLEEMGEPTPKKKRSKISPSQKTVKITTEE
jgi:hypothetical protein